MGLLDNMIKKAVSGAVSDAVGGAVRKAVQPAADAAAQKAADSITQAAQSSVQAAQSSVQAAQASAAAANAAAAEANAAAAEAQGTAASGSTGMPSQAELESAFGMLGQMMQGMADGAAKNLKVCPSCGEAAEADEAFCPKCGAKLPEMTVAQSLVCAKCGKQNKVGQKFCTGCGEKLPAALMEEQAQADKDAAVLAKWQELMPEFPVWSCGGKDFQIEQLDGAIMFGAEFPDSRSAEQAVEAYRALVKSAGFKQEGQYPSDEHLYKRINGVSCHVDTEHCFEGGSESPSIYFNHDNPYGGYDYKKPEPQKKSGGLGGLLGGLFG